jgi:hypothetical protein
MIILFLWVFAIGNGTDRLSRKQEQVELILQTFPGHPVEGEVAHRLPG